MRKRIWYDTASLRPNTPPMISLSPGGTARTRPRQEQPGSDSAQWRRTAQAGCGLRGQKPDGWFFPTAPMPTFYPESVLKSVPKPDIQESTTTLSFSMPSRARTDFGWVRLCRPPRRIALPRVVACQFPGKRTGLGCQKMKVTNLPEANPHLEGKCSSNFALTFFGISKVIL